MIAPHIIGGLVGGALIGFCSRITARAQWPYRRRLGNFRRADHRLKMSGVGPAKHCIHSDHRILLDHIKNKEGVMAKILECGKVDPSSGCQHIVRGETEEEVLQKAAEHAKQHGIRQVTPELIERVKANIRDA
jgi:predicted small metal-binding protein